MDKTFIGNDQRRQKFKQFLYFQQCFQKSSSVDKCIRMWKLFKMLQCFAVHLQHISQESDFPILPRKFIPFIELTLYLNIVMKICSFFLSITSIISLCYQYLVKTDILTWLSNIFYFNLKKINRNRNFLLMYRHTSAYFSTLHLTCKQLLRI